MHKPSDETLIAYLDGELDAGARSEVDSWLESDAELRERVAALAASADALRAAFEPVMHEPVPERLLAAARGTSAEVVNFAAAKKTRAPRPLMARPWARWAAAAGVWSAVAWAISRGATRLPLKSRPTTTPRRAGSTTSPAITSC